MNAIRRGRKKKEIRKNVFGVTEPVRTSLYDVTLENLEMAKRGIFLIRIIYIGEHHYDAEGDLIHSTFYDIIEEVNNSFCDENLTGIFLFYKKFFVHMLEGCEDSIIKHFHLMLEEEIASNLSSIKIITVINHINQRFLNEWIGMSGKPVTLLEKIDPDCDLEKSARYIQNCVQKMYNLCTVVREARIKQIQQNQLESHSSLFIRQDTALSEESSSIQKSIDLEASQLEQLLKQHYPEINLLQFLIQTKYLVDASDYIETYGIISTEDSYQGKIWPIPNTLVPYCLFDKYVDPVLDLPTHEEEQKQDDLIVPQFEEANDKKENENEETTAPQ